MTKAANRKLKRKHRGRPRDEDCERTVSGRKSRSNPAPTDGDGKPMSYVALEARQRINGLSADKAADPHASTALGRLWLSSAITTPMREAGERYLKLHDAAMKAIKAPVGLRVSNMAGDGGDVVTEAYEEWAIKAVAHYEVMKAALQDMGAFYRVTVEAVVIQDSPPPKIVERHLRAGLELLAEKMGLGA